MQLMLILVILFHANIFTSEVIFALAYSVLNTILKIYNLLNGLFYFEIAVENYKCMSTVVGSVNIFGKVKS